MSKSNHSIAFEKRTKPVSFKMTLPHIKRWQTSMNILFLIDKIFNFLIFNRSYELFRILLFVLFEDIVNYLIEE